MFTFKMYDSLELRKIWLGYIEGPGWTLFLTTDGSKPFFMEN